MVRNRKKPGARKVHASVAPPLRFREELARAEQLIAQKAYGEALDILTALNQRYPNRPDVLNLMADVFFETENYPDYLKVAYRIYHLTPDDPYAVFNLASIALTMMFPALAFQLYRRFLNRWPKHEMAAEARTRVEELEELMQAITTSDPLSPDLDTLALHDEMRICMAAGDYEKGKELARKLLARRPDFVPALNNLSLIFWLEGNLEEAIRTAQRVLDIQPQNVHALSNLCRFFYMQGQPEIALEYAQRLKEKKSDVPEVWVKQAEALAFLGDDQGVVSIQYDDKAIASLLPSEVALFYCCRAASEYRLGNARAARSLWKKALTYDADFALARENLENIRRPPHQRHAPWPLPTHYWISHKQLEALSKVLDWARSLPEERGHDLVIRYLEEHLKLSFLARPILDRGSPEAKEFVFRMAELFGYPALLEVLREYALGPQDPDERRLEAARILVEQKVIPPGMVRMWIEGKQTDLLMAGFIVSGEPRPEGMPQGQASVLMEKALKAIKSGRPQEAELLLREAVQMHPQHPGLLYNLAMALQLQGKTEESEAILDRVIESFPDYFFGRIVLARRLLQAGQPDEARDVLLRLMSSRKELHFSEFGALAAVKVDLMLAEKQYEGAASWLKLWERIYPDDPNLKFYKSMPEFRKPTPGGRRMR